MGIKKDFVFFFFARRRNICILELLASLVTVKLGIIGTVKFGNFVDGMKYDPGINLTKLIFVRHGINTTVEKGGRNPQVIMQKKREKGKITFY